MCPPLFFSFAFPALLCAHGSVLRCDTLLPVDLYSRRLSHSPELSPFSSPTSGSSTKSKSAHLFAEAAKRPFTDDITRGAMCAFVAGQADEVDEWTVTIKSIQKFAPGMRVAVAADDSAVMAYER